MMGPFFAALCLGLFLFLLCVVREIRDFRWALAIGKFRYSLTTLMALMSIVAVAMGIHRGQQQSPSLLSTPFPLTVIIALLVVGIFVALIHEFRSLCGTNVSRRSALESYRSRQPTQEVSLSNEMSDTAPSQRQKARGKWWLRRFPTQSKSISPRNFQRAPMPHYNNRND